MGQGGSSQVKKGQGGHEGSRRSSRVMKGQGWLRKVKEGKKDEGEP